MLWGFGWKLMELPLEQGPVRDCPSGLWGWKGLRASSAPALIEMESQGAALGCAQQGGCGWRMLSPSVDTREAQKGAQIQACAQPAPTAPPQVKVVLRCLIQSKSHTSALAEAQPISRPIPSNVGLCMIQCLAPVPLSFSLSTKPLFLC